MFRDTEIKREELCGIILIAVGLLMLLISFKDDPDITIKVPEDHLVL